MANFTKPNQKQLSDEELSKMAIEEILKEAKKAKVRANIEGPSGWEPRKKRINKRFINNTLLANAQFNKRNDLAKSK